MAEKYKPLLVFTTYNKLGMTRKCLEYALDLGFDILVVDDCSIDGTQEYLSQIRVNAILKSERKGLTDSWNRAYKYWKTYEYSHLVLCNNDVMIPAGAIENMLSIHPLVVPMTSYDGAGYMCKHQAVDYHVDLYYDPMQLGEMQKIQDTLKRGFISSPSFTGFCMCISRGIIELPDGNLFDPANINVGNDDELNKRVHAHLALGSFVYHYKGVSFNKQIADRDNLTKDYA